MATKGKISDKQEAIDEGWRLYNRAMEACEELNDHLQEMEDEFEMEETKAHRKGYAAYETLESAYSTGSSILPKHSADGGKAK